jgi:hypothetical protein
LVGGGKAVFAPAVQEPAPVEVTEEVKPEPVKPARKARTYAPKED